MKGVIHLCVIIAGGLSLYWTNLMSPSMFYGGVLPLVDIVFLTYLTVIITHACVKRRGSPVSSVSLDLDSFGGSGDTTCNSSSGDADCSAGA
jgi:hypothetical protein